MKKEVFLAIAIGFALGLVITFGIWTANKSLATLNKNSPATPTPINPAPGGTGANVTPVPNTANSGAFSLQITSPDDEAFTNTATATVSGKTSPGATVVVTYEGDQAILLADVSGNFSTTLDLVAGYNQITATAYDKSGQSASQNITVTYSTAKI